MKNKFIKLLLAVLTLTLSVGFFTACGANHTHDFVIPKFDSSNHWYECSCGEKDYVEAHTGGTATCAKKAVCKLCNAEYGETLSHAYSSVVTEPTCVERGYTTYTCKCGHSYVDDYVDALNHSYEIEVTEPTCTEVGFTTYTCHCGHVYVDDYLDAYYHDYGDWLPSPEGALYKVCSRDSTHKFYKSVDDELAVLYSISDKKLDLDSLKRALDEQEVKIYSLDDIDGYIVNGETSTTLKLSLIISNTEGGFVDNYGRERTVAIPQTVTVIVKGQQYVLDNVYAYSKIIDEAEDLKFFTLKNNKTRNEVQGYFIVTKNIDASELVLDEHDFENRKSNGDSQIYPGNGYDKDVGFKGIFDGQGHTIDGLTVKSNGLFGNANAPVIKNIAFTNVNITGYYGALFAHSFSRGKNPNNNFNGYEGEISNVYVSVNSIEFGGSLRVGILVNNVLPSATKLSNVVVEYLNVDDDTQALIDQGKSFFTFGSSKNSMANAVETYNNCYSISTAPVLSYSAMPGFAENQVEYTLGVAQYGFKVETVGNILDTQVDELLTVHGKELTVDHVLVGLRAYDNYEAMGLDVANDYSSFSANYWTIVNGVPVWKNL